MDILIIGAGGREHALAWKLKQSPKVGKIFVVPGNQKATALPVGLSMRSRTAYFGTGIHAPSMLTSYPSATVRQSLSARMCPSALSQHDMLSVGLRKDWNHGARSESALLGGLPNAGTVSSRSIRSARIIRPTSGKFDAPQKVLPARR